MTYQIYAGMSPHWNWLVSQDDLHGRQCGGMEGRYKKLLNGATRRRQIPYPAQRHNTIDFSSQPS